MTRPDDNMLPVYAELAQVSSSLLRNLVIGSLHAVVQHQLMLLHNLNLVRVQELHAKVSAFSGDKQLGVSAVLLSMDGFHFYKKELDAMSDPAEVSLLQNAQTLQPVTNDSAAYRRRGAHWTFNADRFVQQLALVKAQSSGSFPSFDHCVGDPIEDSTAAAAYIYHTLRRSETSTVALAAVSADTRRYWLTLDLSLTSCTTTACSLQQCADRVVARHIQTGLTHEAAVARVESNDTPNAQFIADHLDLTAVDRTSSCSVTPAADSSDSLTA
eukprot:6918-Heterococcus_DN1.PRE.3